MARSSNAISPFAFKFIDIMVGIVLGMGFQWWTNLHYSWQYIAFIFIYVDLVDYWIDYAPSLKLFPPRREIDLLLDVAIMFSMFLYTYATQLTMPKLLLAFALFCGLDLLWMFRADREYNPKGQTLQFLRTWIGGNIAYIIFSLALVAFTTLYPIADPILLGIFIAYWLLIRVICSLRYKKVFFV